MAAPLIVVRKLHQTGPDRIENDVAHNLLEIRLFFDQMDLRPALEQVPDAAVTAVEQSRIFTIEPVHPFRQRLCSQFYDEVIVISHQDIGGENPPAARHATPEKVEKDAPIAIVEEDRLLGVTASMNVVQGTGKLKSK